MFSDYIFGSIPLKHCDSFVIYKYAKKRRKKKENRNKQKKKDQKQTNTQKKKKTRNNKKITTTTTCEIQENLDFLSFTSCCCFLVS